MMTSVKNCAPDLGWPQNSAARLTFLYMAEEQTAIHPGLLKLISTVALHVMSLSW